MEYTGHPLLDVGIATMVAYADKDAPNDLTADDFDKIAAYMEKNYVVNPLKSFLTVVFPNSGFTQAAYKDTPEKRDIYAKNVLRAFGSKDFSHEKCIFTGKPATSVSLDVKGKLHPGRAYRQHIPLITGENIINFFPNGDAGMPVSGEAVLAIHAFPLGCAKIRGRLLAVHSDNGNITFKFARHFLKQNRQKIQAAQLAGEKKIKEPEKRLQTFLVNTLFELMNETDKLPSSITAYHLNNFGQKADLDIYTLPFEIMDFLQLVYSAKYREKWNKVVARGWEIVSGRRDKKNVSQEPRYNVLYEDLLRLPENAAQFIRRYFLRIPERKKLPGDPRADYSLKTDADLVSWELTELFLGKVVYMDRERIEQIRSIGDGLANYIKEENDRKFFHTFLTAKNYGILRAALIRVNLSLMKKGKRPVIEFDPYIEIFEEGEDLPYSNWRLIRDLLLIRMVERLFELGWVQTHKEDLPVPEVVEEE